MSAIHHDQTYAYSSIEKESHLKIQNANTFVNYKYRTLSVHINVFYHQIKTFDSEPRICYEEKRKERISTFSALSKSKFQLVKILIHSIMAFFSCACLEMRIETILGCERRRLKCKKRVFCWKVETRSGWPRLLFVIKFLLAKIFEITTWKRILQNRRGRCTSEKAGEVMSTMFESPSIRNNQKYKKKLIQLQNKKPASTSYNCYHYLSRCKMRWKASRTGRCRKESDPVSRENYKHIFTVLGIKIQQNRIL